MRLKNSKLLFAVSLFTGCSLLAIPAVGQKQSPGSPAAVPVVVVNSTGAPVPTAPQGITNVAGTVSVGNTPSVTVANTPSVNVANTPSVSIAGTPTVTLAPGGSTSVTNPLNGQNNPTPLVTTEGAQPYEDACSAPSPGQGFITCGFQAIPSGKRLVIQEFDAVGQLGAGVKPISVSLLLGPGLMHWFTATFMGSLGSSDFFATHQETRLYQSVGGPTCEVFMSAPTGGQYTCRISGYLVDVP